LPTANDLIYVRQCTSQWPGYEDWKRQIPAKDETYGRNPITLARFMKHVGTSVNNFINVSLSFLPLSPLLIKLVFWKLMANEQVADD
jgi:hypothetical protein